MNVSATVTQSIPALPDRFFPDHEFPILKHWDFFNHGGVAPICRASAEALRAYSRQALSHAYLKGHWYAQAETTRNLAAQLINADPAEIAFVKNTSEGLAFVANGLKWNAGDEIVSTAVEYPANVYPWMDVSQRFGVKHVMIPERDGRIELQEILDAINPKTRLVALSSVEFASGFRNDIATIGKHCRERNVLFCVDAIQSLGALPIDVETMYIDFLSADGHKWMLAPEGCGFFYCRRHVMDLLHPEVGWWNVINAQDYGNYDFTFRPDAKRFECGSYNIPGILALGASLKMLLDFGIPLIEQRILALTQRLCDGLQDKGYQVISSRRPGESSGIVAFTRPDVDAKKVVNDLREKKIIIVIREGRLRATPHFYNSPEQIERLIKALP